jgi:hypothetical protein
MAGRRRRGAGQPAPASHRLATEPCRIPGPRTIDYLAKETDLVVTANATGTPHFERQPLRHGAGNKLED